MRASTRRTRAARARRRGQQALKSTPYLRRLRFEQLEARRLLAVLAVGAGELFEQIVPAVTAAQPGDIVDVVDQRTYAETIDVSKSISLRSQGATIEGVVNFRNAHNAYISGFNITGADRGIELDNSQVAIVGNYLFGNCHFKEGSAIAVLGASRALIADNLIANNQAGVSGCGGAEHLGAGAIHVSGDSQALISRNEIRDNWQWYAGAVSVQGEAYLDGNYIHHNSGDFGGGVYVFGDGDAQLSHNVITENIARFRTGAGLMLEGQASAFAWNNTLANNPGAGVHFGFGVMAGASTDLSAVNNIIVFDDVGVQASASAQVDFNMLSGPGSPYSGGVVPGPGSQIATPTFISPLTGDYRLAAGSPGHNEGHAGDDWRNLDGSGNTLGAEGGPATFALPAATLASLGEVLETSANYFFDTNVLNTQIGWSRGFFGDGPWRENVNGTLIPRLTPLPVGFGNHVNMNEVTLGFIMQALAALDGEVAPAQAVGLIRTGLQTMRSLQTSNNPDAYHPSGAFYRYETRISRPGEPPDQNRRVDELVGIQGHDFQQLITSDDNALARRNLGLLNGILAELPGTDDLPSLIEAIRGDIQLRQFIADDGNSIVFEIKDGVKSASWDRRAAEGSLIAAELLVGGEIDAGLFSHLVNQMSAPTANWTSDSTSPALPNSPLPAAFGDHTILDGNFHGAAFMYALRMIHGYFATPWESPSANYHARAMGPAIQSQLEYALHNNLTWMSSQVMTGELDLVGLVNSPVNGALHRFPGNDGTHCGCGGSSFKPDARFAIMTGAPLDTDLARATGAHANLAPFYRWQHVQPAHWYLADTWQADYRTRFWDNRFGFSESLPWRADSTAHAWTAQNIAYFTDMGDAFETLGKAYSGIAAHDALNPTAPLSSFSPDVAADEAIVAFLDGNTPINPGLFPSRLALELADLSLVEGEAATTATVRRINSDISAPLVVNIGNPSGQFITLPPSVTIPAWQMEAQFTVAARPDQILDGDVDADVVVTAASHAQAAVTITAVDAEFVSLEIPVTELAENAQSTTLQLQRSDVNSAFDLEVSLSAAPGGDFVLPTTFTLPAGAASSPLQITTIDNNVLDGRRSHTISISAANYSGDSSDLDITDHETLTLAASTDTIHEEDGPQALTLQIQRSDTGDLSNAVVVNLNVPSPLRVDSTQVTIPATQSEITIDVGVIDNTQQGVSPRSIDVTADAAGFGQGSETIDVLDEHDDFPYHNWKNPFNVVNDTAAVNLVDPLHVVDVLRAAGGPTDLTGTPLGDPPRYPDVEPNNRADLLDAFSAIDDIRDRLGQSSGPEGEGALAPFLADAFYRNEFQSSRQWAGVERTDLARDATDLTPNGDALRAFQIASLDALDLYFRRLIANEFQDEALGIEWEQFSDEP